MLKAYIVEDEIKAVELLQSYLQKIDFLELIGTARNPMKAFTFLEQNQVDVLFLDINMPMLSGVELYKNLTQPPAVIFTTAYPEFAVEGFNLEAVDYLVKPITFPRFLQAAQRLLKRQQQTAPDELTPTNAFADLIYIKSGAITHKISWREVLYLEKDENYVIYHTSQKRILSRQTLTDLEKTFPSYICRIHKSYAVSLLHIQQIQRETALIGTKKLPIGRTYKSKLIERLERKNP